MALSSDVVRRQILVGLVHTSHVVVVHVYHDKLVKNNSISSRNNPLLLNASCFVNRRDSTKFFFVRVLLNQTFLFASKGGFAFPQGNFVHTSWHTSVRPYCSSDSSVSQEKIVHKADTRVPVIDVHDFPQSKQPAFSRREMTIFSDFVRPYCSILTWSWISISGCCPT